MGMERVAIALGSNLGDRRGHLTRAVAGLRRHLSHLRLSSIIETAPFQVHEPQPPYLNAVVVGETALEPPALLDALMAIEREAGRERPSVRAARTLDLDLILYGDRVLDQPGLTIPHPHFRERLFVLEPLVELAPAWPDPVTGRTMGELVAGLRRQGD